MASAVARVLAVFAAAVACGMSGTASASGNATAKYTPGVPPSESSMVNFYYQMEQAMSTYLWSKSPITDDLACFYGDVPGPEGNRVQAAVASGKSLNDMGNYDMCNHANGTQYCTVTIGYNNLSVTGIRMGFCVAKTCNESQLSFVVNDLINIVAPSIDPFIYINNATVHCPQDPGPVRPALYVAIAINAVLLVLCIVGTWMKWPKSIPPQSVSADTSHDGALSRPLMDVAKDAPEPQPVAERKPKNALEHIVFAFDIVTNWKKLMVKPVDERLACLNGVRALSMFWIIYCTCDRETPSPAAHVFSLFVLIAAAAATTRHRRCAVFNLCFCFCFCFRVLLPAALFRGTCVQPTHSSTLSRPTS